LEALTKAIDAVLAVDVQALTDAEVHDLTVGLQRQTSRLAAARAEASAAWDGRRLWAEDGSKSAGARLARECSMDPDTAKTEIRRARKLRSMPATVAALADGSLSIDYADLLARANSGEARSFFARDEEMLVNLLRPMRHATAKRTVAYWRSNADDESEKKRADRQTARRHGCADRTFKGGVHVSAFFPRVAGTAFYDEFHRLERQLFEKDLAEARRLHGDDAMAHLARTGAQRGADAMMLMAERSAIAPEGGRKPAPLFTVLVGYETFAGRVCELEDGTVVHPTELQQFLAEAEIERIVFAGPARVIEVGKRTRFFTGALRRAIQVRDRHCQDPSGCDEPITRSEADHIEEFEDGGFTTQDNGELKCGHHNRRKNRMKRRGPPNRPSAQERLDELRRRLTAAALMEPVEPDDSG
jgi:hypothetical protein